MANTVNITINVSDGDATPVIQQVVAQLREIGPAGEAAGAQAGAGLDQIGEHALTSLDNVRLLRDDLGIHIPRSMEKAIASSQMLSGAIAGVGSGFLVLGAVEIFAHIGESIYNAYEKYIDINAAQDEYNKKLAEAQGKDFVNTHSLDVTIERLNQAQSAMTSMRDVAESMNKAGWLDVAQGVLSGNVGSIAAGAGMLGGAKSAADSSVEYQEQAAALTMRRLEQQHQLNLAVIDEEHAGDGVLKGQAKINAGVAEETQKRKENAAYAEHLDNVLNTTANQVMKWSPDIARTIKSTHNPLEDTDDAAAKKKAAAEGIEIQRQYTNEVIQMQNEAVNAALEGNALRAAQEQQAIAAIVLKYKEGEIDKQTASAETAAVEKKFAAEALKIQQQLDEQTKHMADEAAQAGLKGSALLAAQLKTQLDAIDAAERKAVGPGGTETGAQSADYNSQRDSTRQEFYQKGLEEQEQYEERRQGIMERADDFEMEGYAKINAEEQRRLNDAAKLEMEHNATLEDQTSAYVQDIVRIAADADRERQQLHQKTMEQLTKEEQQTARMLLPEWEQAQLAIEDTYTDRLHQIQQDVKQHVMTEQEGAAAVTAAWQQAAAQMEKAEEESRDKIASGLQSLFSHPEKFFEDTAMKTGFQLMANEMLSVFQSSGSTGGMLQYLFGMGPQMSTSTNPLTAIQSALGLGGGGGHAGGIGAATNPGMIQFSQGSTTLLTGSQVLMQAATSLQSAAGSIGAGGGMGGGLLGSGGNTLAFPGSSNSGGDFGSAGASAAAVGSSSSSTAASYPQLLAPGQGSYTSAAGNGIVDASALGPAGSGFSDSNAAGAPGSALGAGMGIAGGALMGGMSIFSAYQNSNPVAGLAGGAMGGMEAGAALGSIIPGLGTVVGGAIGAIAGGLAGLFAGIFGDQGRGQAESLDVNTVQPELTKDMQDYEAGRSGYSTIAANLTNMLTSAKNSTTQMGSGARNYFSSNIEPEINTALLSLQKQEAGGRGAVTMSAAQYHTGGMIGDFGDMATSDTEGFIHAMRNEFVVNPVAASAHMPILQAMNSGTSFGAVQPRMPASSSSGGGGTLIIKAIDSMDVATWAKTRGGGRALAAALNQSNGSYSGIGRG